MKKMLVFDLDGTLLDENGKVTPETKKFLNSKKEQGYIIVLATGRILKSIFNATDGAEFSNYIITDNGSAIYDTMSRQYIFIKTIPKEIVKRYFKYYNDKCRYIKVCNKEFVYKYSDEEESGNIVITSKDKDKILDMVDSITHVSISMYENDDIERLYKDVVLDFPELDSIIVKYSFEERKWIESQPKGCSKYNAIQKIANYLNISNENIIAFGDGSNDIDMIKKCGVGIAMSNALDEVKNVADYITDKPNTENGIINFLRNYLVDSIY